MIAAKKPPQSGSCGRRTPLPNKKIFLLRQIPQSERCDFLPFRGGAAAAAEGVVIYRLPYRAALSVRRSLRAVRIAERNRYTENTPLGTPSGTAKRRKRLFFWLQKSGVNCEKRKRLALSGDTTPQSRRFNPKPPCQLPLHRGAEVCPPSEWCEPRTREPRTAAEPPSQKQKNKPSQSGGEKKIFFLKGER